MSNIFGLTQNGADGSFASDTYIGLSFTLGTDASYPAAGAHEASVSSGRTGALTENLGPVLTAPSDLAANSDSRATTISLDVTPLGSANDNVDSGMGFTYRIGGTTLTAFMAFRSVKPS